MIAMMFETCPVWVALALMLGGCSLLNTRYVGDLAGSGSPVDQAADLTVQGLDQASLPGPRDLGFAVPSGMAWIEGGTFQMGNTLATDRDASPNEAPVHAVTVKSFFLDRTEVTVAAYRACYNNGTGPCIAPDTSQYCNWTVAAGQKENHPINCVDWNQATAYCTWAKKRLPTEPEWEYAARGPGGSRYPWGPAAPTEQLCWSQYVLGDGGKTYLGTCPVGKYQATRLGTYDLYGLPGLVDLAGNVWEWTSTRYCPMSDGTGNCNLSYVVRGGSWDRDDYHYMRGAFRDYDSASNSLYDRGFRCAQD